MGVRRREGRRVVTRRARLRKGASIKSHSTKQILFGPEILMTLLMRGMERFIRA